MKSLTSVKHWKLTAAFCAYLAVSLPIAAHASTVQCFGCSDADMLAHAQANIYKIQTTGPMYIVDSERSKVRKFAYFNDITPETDPENDPVNAWVEEIPVEPAITSAVTEYHNRVAQAVGNRREIHVPDIPNLYPSDAHDALNNAAQMDRLTEWVRGQTNEGRLTEIRNWFSQWNNPYWNGNNIAPAIKLIFPNGSSITITYSKDLASCEKQPQTARDARGNKIPLTRQDVFPISEYVFYAVDENPVDRDNMADMVGRLEAMGIPVIDVTRGSTGGGLYFMTCAGDYCTIWLKK